jgi:hypothetical protein
MINQTDLLKATNVVIPAKAGIQCVVDGRSIYRPKSGFPPARE